MASSSSQVVDINAEEAIETLSIYNCIFCKNLLNSEAKLLECLHIICTKCLEKKTENAGLQCKCLTVTDISDDVIAHYPISLLKVIEPKNCNVCDLEAAYRCLNCRQYYCKPCKTAHFRSDNDCNSTIKAVDPYPLPYKFILCQTCTEKKAELHCTKCSLMACPICHLDKHQSHEFMIFKDLSHERKIRLSETLLGLNNDEEYLGMTDDIIKRETMNLENQKILIFDDIDSVTKKMHEEIDRRSLELKELAENNFRNSISMLNHNKIIIQNVEEKRKYDIKLIKAIMDIKEVDDFLPLSKTVLRTFELNNTINIFSSAFGLNADLKFNTDASIENCISAIQNFGNITATPVLDFSTIFRDFIRTPNNDSQDLINSQTTDTNDSTTTENDLSSNNEYECDSDSSSGDDLLLECLCCNRLDVCSELIQCKTCDRRYHRQCHIPFPPPDFCTPLEIMWKCTLCKDMTRHVVEHNPLDLLGLASIGNDKLIIMQRLLMEMYCQKPESEHFRELPNADLHPGYYQRVIFPLSLNDVKKKLETGQSYRKFIHFIYDLKHVFSNALWYYTPRDPIFQCAKTLLVLLRKLVNKWVPQFKI